MTDIAAVRAQQLAAVALIEGTMQPHDPAYLTLLPTTIDDGQALAVALAQTAGMVLRAVAPGREREVVRFLREGAMAREDAGYPDAQGSPTVTPPEVATCAMRDCGRPADADYLPCAACTRWARLLGAGVPRALARRAADGAVLTAVVSFDDDARPVAEQWRLDGERWAG